MEIELQEIRDFLAQCHPFDVLDDELLDELPKSLEIRYLRRGSDFPPAPRGNEGHSEALYIVRSGAVEVTDLDGKLLEMLGEGNLYTAPCQMLDLNRSTHGVAAEDTLLYLMKCWKLKELSKISEEFDKHFSDSVRDRLKRAVAQTLPQTTDAGPVMEMSLEVGELLRMEPVVCTPDTSIQEAARRMTEYGVSSLMVLDGEELKGVVTDRDLRKRCVAEGVPVDSPVSGVMTREVECIEHDALMVDALLAMTRQHANHLPVLRDGKVIGLLTTTDLVRQQNANSAYIARQVRKAQGVDELVRACTRLPELQTQLARSNATAQHLGEAVSAITDAVTRRLIEMAQKELGPEPVPFCWVAGGSQARREQTAHSDQDNALILSDDLQPEHMAYFRSLARFVSDGLNACGYVYCPGNAMATNPDWCQPVGVWRDYFARWIDSPEPKALMLASIFFDLQPVFGDRTLFESMQNEVLTKTRDNKIFIAYMAANALTHRPPLGFFRTFVLIHDGEHDDTLDVKHRGIVPITDLARVFALTEGLTEVNTTDRLRAAAKTTSVTAEMAENLQDALEFIASLRIRHQAEQIQKGEPADNFLAPDELSELERSHLKEAFKIIKSMQDTLENRFQLGRF